MPSARDYLNSIISTAAGMQNMTDEELEQHKRGLTDADEAMMAASEKDEE